MLTCISYQYMIKLGIIAWYELNKEYVAAALCENKNKPELNCCGKCYLNKQLKKADNPKEDSKQLPSKNYKAELSEFLPAAITGISYITPPGAKIFHDSYISPKAYSPVAAIFHPPPVS